MQYITSHHTTTYAHAHPEADPVMANTYGVRPTVPDVFRDVTHKLGDGSERACSPLKVCWERRSTNILYYRSPRH